MSEPVLRGVKLYRDYGRKRRLHKNDHEIARKPALGGVSIDLYQGSTLGVIGESGSGKSTLARCLTLLEQPDSGQVFLKGQELTGLSGRNLRRRRHVVQTIFQDPYLSLNPRYTVESTLREVLHVHRLVNNNTADRRIHELLDMVGLPLTALNRRPADFSGGQRQRIGIARALAADPEILIADEAVSALDVLIQAQILNLFLSLKTELNLSMIFISHDMHVIRYVADEVVVMLGGVVVERLSDSASLEQPEHPYTQALIAATPSLRNPISREFGTPRAANGSTDGPHDPSGTPPRISDDQQPTTPERHKR